MRRFPIFGTLLLIPAITMFAFIGGCTPAKVPEKKSEDKPAETTKDDATKKRTPITTATTGTIKGVVKYKGTPPEPKVLDEISKHKDGPQCLASKNKDDLIDQTWIVGKDGGVANVVVSIEPPSGKEFKVSEEMKSAYKKPVVIDQPFCMYRPHVVALYAKVEPLVFKNSAKFAHNVKVTAGPQDGTTDTLLSPGSDSEPRTYKMFSPGIVSISCSMHGWMNAKAVLFPHPYFAVTKDDGAFEIKNVPVDTPLTVYMWHEATGKVKEEDVTAKDGATAEVKLGIAAK